MKFKNLKMCGLGIALALVTLAMGSQSVGLAQDCTITVQPGQQLFSILLQASDGAVVCLGAGTYQELLFILKSVTIKGAGKGQTILQGLALAVVNIASNGEVTLQDLTISGNQNTIGILGIGTGKINLRNIEVTGNGQSGVAVSGNATLTVENSDISRNTSAGLTAGKDTTVIIRGSNLSDNGNPAGESQFGRGIELSGSASATIEGNTIARNDNWGIILGESAKATIRGNTISSNGRFPIGGGGIRIGFGNVNNSGVQVEISQNTIETNRGCGVSVDPAIHVSGSGNSFSGNRPDLCPPVGEYSWPPGF
ncbi:right-handed parallel beta-helix repeat-containing protein [Candidatus Acetothermia bacterium]|nr:right-handed parallel beta-helix repeat-containing protein [Candidatus Acetothermia bacterium]MBI3660301.1 right-handed parallel beta-helix repeat-containing protein [Candidatus Acetothermia bacterium]